MTAAELALAWLAAFNEGDESGFAELCVPNVHYEDPLTEEPLRGAAAVAGHAERLRSALDEARFEKAGRAACGDECLAVPWRLQGTHARPFGGLPATGRSLSLDGVFYCELDGADTPRAGNRLLRVRAFFDLYDAAVQLAVLPRPGTLSERALLMLRGFGLRLSGP